MNRVELAMACGIALASMNLVEAGKFRHAALSRAAVATAPQASEQLVANDLATDVQGVLWDAHAWMEFAPATSERSDTGATDVALDQELALDLDCGCLVDYLKVSPGANVTSTITTVAGAVLPPRAVMPPRRLRSADVSQLIESAPETTSAADTAGLWEFFSRDLPMAATGESDEDRPIVIENVRFVSGRPY